MMRPAMILILLLSTAVMMRGVASDWKKGPVMPTEVAAKKASPPSPAESSAALPQVKAFQPAVPGILPDLKEGYLFNQERGLAGAEPPKGEEVEPADSGVSPLGIEASIDEVTYVGSIIAEAFSRAIILYPATAKAKGKPEAATPQPSSRSSNTKKPPAASPAGEEEHAQIEVGDVLDGYEVAEILPDKLIFTKGEETVEKLLHDPEKKRKEPPPRPAGPAPGTPRAPQQPPGGAPPVPPAGVQSTTIGGAAVPPPPPAAAVPANPAHAAPQAPAATPTPPAAVRPNIPAASSAAPGTQTTPVRRMVISRQPTPGPNTSRVLRQSTEAGGIIPTPPGMTPGDTSVTTPPAEGE